ncbi:MAG: transcriptional activator NhaR [Deltaproteobacteria bacterium]|jgi:LysR family transcriptional activator of nhaA|nr:transcriptional activator NhaR [Deltaproteobacteria bacterium]MBK8695030.1 transcriptional activator NhaR [Deltaproteobacteria bacterium]MBP6830149.1 transcriptional activator NhaR [Deltaproteobacteria bacterium]
MNFNYHHLHYFWVVARKGSIVAAAAELHVSQPTISLQLKELERSLDRKLLERSGRSLTLTAAGHVVYSYAQEIFSLGQALVDAVEHQPAERALRLSVGIVDALPKSVVYRLLAPALRLPQPVRLICREDKGERLLEDLAARRFDVVLSDSPMGTAMHLRGYHHLLGESGVTFFATASLAERYRRGFPRSLDGAPMLLPTEHTAMRRSLNLWFESLRIHPVVVAEFDDGATMASFGRAGVGVFPAPSVVAEEVCHEHAVAVVGRSEKLRERFYAITTEAQLQHPGVAAIREAELFS